MLSVPVLMFVVVGLAYSALRFRAYGDEEDGPPIHGSRGFQAVWLGVSFALVIGLFGYGAVGLIDIRGAQASDFEVQVRAEQWAWHFEYPIGGVDSKELHIPVGERVHLVINSDDVIHSFWVPAFGDQAGRRAGTSDPDLRDRHRRRARIRACAPSCAASGTPTCASRWWSVSGLTSKPG